MLVLGGCFHAVSCLLLQMTVLLIPDLLSVLIVALTVLLVDLCLFGFMTLWGLRLNLITMVNLLLAIGMCGHQDALLSPPSVLVFLLFSLYRFC